MLLFFFNLSIFLQCVRIAVSWCLLGRQYTKVELALLAAICLMYIPIFLTGPEEMDHGTEGFLFQLETHLESPLTISFLCLFFLSLLGNATVVSVLTVNTEYRSTITICAAAFIASIASAFLVLFKISIEVIGRIIRDVTRLIFTKNLLYARKLRKT